MLQINPSILMGVLTVKLGNTSPKSDISQGKPPNEKGSTTRQIPVLQMNHPALPNPYLDCRLGFMKQRHLPLHV
jgi:hypothetical protein